MDNKFLLRQANEHDAPAVMECAKLAYTPYISSIGQAPAPLTEDYKKRIADGQVHVLTRGDVIVGFLIYHVEEDHLFVDNIAILPDWQGKFLGAIYLRFVEKEALKLGLPALRLHTNVKMVRNIALYKKAGFHELYVKKEGEFERVYMEKKLCG